MVVAYFSLGLPLGFHSDLIINPRSRAENRSLQDQKIYWAFLLEYLSDIFFFFFGMAGHSCHASFDQRPYPSDQTFLLLTQGRSKYL